MKTFKEFLNEQSIAADDIVYTSHIKSDDGGNGPTAHTHKTKQDAERHIKDTIARYHPTRRHAISGKVEAHSVKDYWKYHKPNSVEHHDYHDTALHFIANQHGIGDLKHIKPGYRPTKKDHEKGAYRVPYTNNDAYDKVAKDNRYNEFHRDISKISKEYHKSKQNKD